MRYPALSFKNQKLLRKLRTYGDVSLDLNSDNFPEYKESDAYELVENGYFRCELSKSHYRTGSNKWGFTGFVTHKGYTYYRGRFNEYLMSTGFFGGCIALLEFIIELVI